MFGSIKSLVAALAGLLFVVGAPPAVAQQPPPALKVATRVIPPFVKQDGDALTGFSIELWRALARDLDVKFDFVVTGSMPDLLAEIAQKRVDLAIAAISITAEREKTFDFSQPMFDAGLQILVPARQDGPGGLIAIASLLKSPAMIDMLMLLIVLALLPVPLVWWAERGRDDGVSAGRTAGGSFFNTIWWSSSTLGAQATNMPVTPLGKVIALVWMFVSVIYVSFFTASVTSALTVKQLEASIGGPQDLPGKRIAVTTGGTAATWARQQSIESVEFPAIEQAFAALLDGRAQAVVADAPVLLYYASHEGKGKVQIAGPVFRPEAYGILFPDGSPLRKQVNEAMLRLKESGEYRALYRKYFASEADKE